jgi:hypothetical protein
MLLIAFDAFWPVFSVLSSSSISKLIYKLHSEGRIFVQLRRMGLKSRGRILLDLLLSMELEKLSCS